MNIEDRIKQVDLRPSDIVKLQVPSETKPIGLSQATGWIKSPTATKAIEQLLWRLCDLKLEFGLTFDKPGRKKDSVVAGIFQQKKEMTKEELDWCERNGVETGDGPENAPKKDKILVYRKTGLPLDPSDPKHTPAVSDEEGQMTSMDDIARIHSASSKKEAKAIIKEISEKIPAKPTRTVELEAFAANTMDVAMTRKFKAGAWILYCEKKKYRLGAEDASCSIITEEGVFVLSDFTEV